MAKTNNSARGIHVSPGIYSKETTLEYASKSLGITKLAAVGETEKGPAFQVLNFANWREFTDVCGGTNPAKFKGSQYPKYELPYIAKEYLKESDQLQVVRVLGLSGVNAGPAWLITAYGASTSKYPASNPMVIGVLRSRGEHKKARLVASTGGECNAPVYEYDGIEYFAKSVRLEASTRFSSAGTCTVTPSRNALDFSVSTLNMGAFTIVVNEESRYDVSLNPAAQNYIYKMIGGAADDGNNAEVFIEELYDVALESLIVDGSINMINNELIEILPTTIIPKYEAVDDILTLDESELRRSHVGKRYLYSSTLSTFAPTGAVAGQIYAVVAQKVSGSTRYVYSAVANNALQVNTNGSGYRTNYTPADYETNQTVPIYEEAVYCNADDSYYFRTANDVARVSLDFNNYKEQYRYASTPWVLSEAKGSGENVELVKLFRFHMISDGESSNTMVKVSIENIDPEDGTFDVKVRDFNDTDSSPRILERYTQCNLIPGTSKYLPLLIGSSDEQYEIKSKYITVEMSENEKVKTCVPAGFMGYPIRDYEGGTIIDAPADLANVKAPEFQYNTVIDSDVKAAKQYFGVSDRTGIDSDVLKYKGVEAYDGYGLTPCFHLDSRIFSGKPETDGKISNGTYRQAVSIDGVSGYSWQTVSDALRSNYGDVAPQFGDTADMEGTIYEDKKYRKFTMAFYGGWDGWDYYRTSRSTTDNFTYKKYKGDINTTSGVGSVVSILQNAASYGLDDETRALTSDYYAFLSGYRQFSNPNETDINVFVTPGIDYVNNLSLVEEVIDMVENERADAVYIVTTPDKPFGAGDTEHEMYSPQEAAWNLEDSDIDSNYTATYYPWIKYEDKDNNQYIYLPPTKDVVRNMAYTDNVAYPWFAAAGWNRGTINGERPRKSLKLSEQDKLYDGRLNFVNTFVSEGMKIWGDKNLQVADTLMNRLSKRRLLLRIRKLCSIAAIGLLFDPNDVTMVKSFRSAITPVLDGVLANRGISDWRLEIDDSAEARDRLELNATIYIKPIGCLEYINLDFVITPQSTVWEN